MESSQNAIVSSATVWWMQGGLSCLPHFRANQAREASACLQREAQKQTCPGTAGEHLKNEGDVEDPHQTMCKWRAGEQSSNHGQWSESVNPVSHSTTTRHAQCCSINQHSLSLVKCSGAVILLAKQHSLLLSKVVHCIFAVLHSEVHS